MEELSIDDKFKDCVVVDSRLFKRDESSKVLGFNLDRTTVTYLSWHRDYSSLLKNLDREGNYNSLVWLTKNDPFLLVDEGEDGTLYIRVNEEYKKGSDRQMPHIEVQTSNTFDSELTEKKLDDTYTYTSNLFGSKSMGGMILKDDEIEVFLTVDRKQLKSDHKDTKQALYAQSNF